MVRKLAEDYITWVLKINVSKSEYLVVGFGGQDLDLGTNLIRTSSSFKYLGVIITSYANRNQEI